MVVLAGATSIKVVALALSFFVTAGTAGISNVISKYEGMKEAYKSVLDDEFLGCNDHPSFHILGAKSELLEQIINELKELCAKENGGA